MIAQSLIQENKLEEAQTFLENNQDKAQPYYFYVIASQAGQNEAQTDLALKAIDQGQALTRAQLSQPDKFKPAYYTEEEWKRAIREKSGAHVSRPERSNINEKGPSE